MKLLCVLVAEHPLAQVSVSVRCIAYTGVAALPELAEDCAQFVPVVGHLPVLDSVCCGARSVCARCGELTRQGFCLGLGCSMHPEMVLYWD